MSERTGEVRDASLPTSPALPALPQKTTTSGSEGMVGSSSTREQSPTEPNPDDDRRQLCGMRRTLTTVTLLDYTPDAVSRILKSKPWARLIRGQGWTFPTKYLEHVERLLDGADVDLFDVDGFLTPAQRLRERDQARAETARVVAELRAARAAAEADPRAVRDAREACRAAFAAVTKRDEVAS